MTHGAYQIAEIKLAYRNKIDISSRPKITQSKDAYPILLEAWDADKIGYIEQSKVLLLNQANRVLGIYDLSTGGLTGTICDPKLIFAAALKTNACNLILAHNHPSENMVPSRADKELTEKIKQAGITMDISVLDHLIVSPHSYYSFSDDATYYRKDLGITIDKYDTVPKPLMTVAAETQNMQPSTPRTITADALQQDIIARALTRSQLSYGALLATWQENAMDIQQSFRMFCLDKDCRIISLHMMPREMRFETCPDAAFLISLACRDQASFIALAQNKPYGVIIPKVADLDFADMLNAAGHDHDITLLDYLFINKSGYYSYNDNKFHLAAAMQPV